MHSELTWRVLLRGVVLLADLLASLSLVANELAYRSAHQRPQAGGIDVLFANASVYELGALGEISEEHFDKTFDINVRGLLFTVQRLLPLLPNGASVIMTGWRLSGHDGQRAFPYERRGCPGGRQGFESPAAPHPRVIRFRADPTT